MKLIPLTKGYFTKVDDEDFERFAKYRWQASIMKSGVRPTRAVYKDGVKVATAYLYREIIGAKKGQYVDHINGNTLDNRRRNLRFSSNAENSRNKIRNKGKQSCPYKGVYPYGKNGKWKAEICKDYKLFKLGVFGTSEEAARAYDEKAVLLHGEFARLNFAQK